MKKGFTLAEVLVTLGIIGVVAALTLPTLTAKVGKSKIGPALLKFVTTFENANRQYLADRGLDTHVEYRYTYNQSLNGGKGDVEGDNTKQPPFYDTINDLGNYINWAPVTNQTIKNKKYTMLYGAGSWFASYEAIANSDEKSTNRFIVRQMKDGSLVIFRDLKGYSSSTNMCKTGVSAGTCYHSWHNTDMADYKGYAYVIYYDINGFKGPNRLAQDIFVFYWDISGRLVPNGSALEAQLWAYTSDGKYAGRVRRCSPTDQTDTERELTSWGCAGDIADHGWTVTY